MDNIINSLVADLVTYSSKDIRLLAYFHKVPVDLQIIAKCNLSNTVKARMYGRTFDSSQISDVVNIINDRLKSNICLHTALVITHYTDKPNVDFFASMHLDISKRKYDIYEQASTSTLAGTTFAPDPMIKEILAMTKPRYCFFALWVKRDANDPNLPVLDTHLTLVLCDKKNDQLYDVYKYNSAVVDEKTEKKLDRSIVHFFSLLQPCSPYKYNIVPTISWCPRQLQGTGNLCAVFVFNIYYYISKYRLMTIEQILESKLQRMDVVIPFLKEITDIIPGIGKYEISL